MRRPFDQTYPVTQVFNDPCCRASYAKFSLKGHSGYDYGLPSWTPVLAPHAGQVLEARFDAGYGNYVKIDDGIQGSVLAHLAKISVQVGQAVSEGQLLGYSGTTGNSTGPHLHWGYYRHPRDRANGFNGFIDQDPYLNAPRPAPTPAIPVTTYDPALFIQLDPDDPSRIKVNLGEIGWFERQALFSEVSDLRRLAKALGDDNVKLRRAIRDLETREIAESAPVTPEMPPKTAPATVIDGWTGQEYQPLLDGLIKLLRNLYDKIRPSK